MATLMAEEGSWPCGHQYRQVGATIVQWSSGSTDEAPPMDAAKMALCRCDYCGEESWIPVRGDQ